MDRRGRHAGSAHEVWCHPDMHGITDGLPSRRRDYVLCKVCQIRNGSALLYQCLRESQDSQMWHRDAADTLLERGKCHCVLVVRS